MNQTEIYVLALLIAISIIIIIYIYVKNLFDTSFSSKLSNESFTAIQQMDSPKSMNTLQNVSISGNNTPSMWGKNIDTNGIKQNAASAINFSSINKSNSNINLDNVSTSRLNTFGSNNTIGNSLVTNNLEFNNNDVLNNAGQTYVTGTGKVNDMNITSELNALKLATQGPIGSFDELTNNSSRTANLDLVNSNSNENKIINNSEYTKFYNNVARDNSTIMASSEMTPEFYNTFKDGVVNSPYANNGILAANSNESNVTSENNDFTQIYTPISQVSTILPPWISPAWNPNKENPSNIEPLSKVPETLQNDSRLLYNKCSFSCCSPQYPSPLYGDAMDGPKSGIPNNFSCSSSIGGSGCLCMTKEQNAGL